MQKESNIYLDLKYGNRNKVFNKIREAGSISSSALSYELQLSRPTIKQNVDELLEMGLITEGRQGVFYGEILRFKNME